MPFCPACREEFREGFTQCSDCGAALVAELPSEAVAVEEGADSGWEQVAETAQIFEAELMAMRLRAAGIEAQVVDQTFHQEPFTNRDFSRVRVLVPPGRAEEAQAVLEKADPLPEDADVGSPEGEGEGEGEDEDKGSL
jgi:hypothetical protein